MSEYVFPELARHLKERSDVKSKGYGTPLRTNNGRNPLVDTYQELLDAILYLNQYLFDVGNDSVTLNISDYYWIDSEPSPVDNGGVVVIDDVLDDLKRGMYRVMLELTYEYEEVNTSLYINTVQLAERVRVEIENSKTKVPLSRGG